MNESIKYELSSFIRAKALELGFSHCGFSRADHLEQEEPYLQQWLSKGLHGDLKYMERQNEERLDPRKLLENSKTIISLLSNYYPENTIPKEDNYIICRYAYGRDHHKIIGSKLNTLIEEIEKKSGKIEARAYIDSGPVLEKAWAKRAGLGWVGKNTILINPEIGSFFFISDIITDLELDYNSSSINDHCGNCTECIDHCPTGALIGPRVLDVNRCIAYHTIESRGEMPRELKGHFNNRIFGCDICQECCPWNKKAVPHNEPQFLPSTELSGMRKKDWEKLSRADFDRLFGGSAIRRAKFEKLVENIEFVKK
jgi:epoxyqueuosine reductase